MNSKYNLTEGPILQKLVALSMPIMATSFMQSAHNFVNMFWLSNLGSDYVAAANLASQFIWLSMSLIMLCRIGTEIGVSQNMGRGLPDAARKFAQNGFLLSMVLGAMYTVILIVFRRSFIAFFGLDDPYTVEIAMHYLSIIAISLPFTFAHFVVTGVYSGCGNTKLPFYINTGALLLNIILSPILIFGLNLGITGAGIAMVTAAVANFIMKVWAMKFYKQRPFEKYTVLVKVAKDKILQILKWGVPVGVESMLFTMLFMIVSRLIASDFGTDAVAAHGIGMQIESLAFMAAGGFASALTAFIGQNYGAKKWARLRSTFKHAYKAMFIYGLAITAFLFFLAEPLVLLFFRDDPLNPAVEIGANYLRILAMAQLLFCLESVAVGSFRGRGLTVNPTVVGISSNVLRVIVTYALARGTPLGVTGVWVGIAIAMTVKSVWMLIWHKINVTKMPRLDEAVVAEAE